MNKHEFENEVRAHFRPEQQHLVAEALSAAWKYIERPYGYYDQNVNDATLFVQRLMPLLAREDGKQSESTHTHSLLTPDVLLTSDFLADKIAPWVGMMRERLFGSPQARFQSMNEATKWIEHESQGLDEETREEANQLAERLQEITHWSISGKVLPHPGEDGWLKNTPVWPGTSLELIADETLRMEKATGFNQASLVMYMLADIKPLLVRIRQTKHIAHYPLPTGEALTPRHITLDIWAKDLSFEDLQGVYKGIRKELKVVKKKGLKQEHWELYQIVQQKGGAPRGKGTVAFWESVKDEYKEKCRDVKCGSWKAAKIAYDRMIQTLEECYGSSPSSYPRKVKGKGIF